MRCPVCRAENDGEAACRRCRADLSLLVVLETRRQFELKAAQTALLVQNAKKLLGHARVAHHLRQGEDAIRLLALGNLLARDYAQALRWHQLTKKNPDATRSAD
jgi:hypothetical protein